MILDFKEIPVANKGGDGQDAFELFACEFLEAIGFKILRRPARGADGKKDLIVQEVRKGQEGETCINWLVSCKHYAHSGKSVSSSDEQDISDRLQQHNCQGFLGFYSTIQSSSLEEKLNTFKNRFEVAIYDKARIERALLNSTQKWVLRSSYFPESVASVRASLAEVEDSKDDNNKVNVSTIPNRKEFLEICKTAIAVLEIEKIRTEYFDNDWNFENSPLDKLYWYANHSNVEIADAVFSLLNAISNITRAGLSDEIVHRIYSLVLTFFPTDYNNIDAETENGKQCIYVGFNLAYDAFIYLNDFKVAQYGLSIIKYIYQIAKRNQITELSDLATLQFDELESTLKRPERNDLGTAQTFLHYFKKDLNVKGLQIPSLPKEIIQLIL